MTLRFAAGAQLRVAISGQSDVGECRRSVKRLGEGAKFDETGIGRASIIASELATNIFRHAGSGELLMQVVQEGDAAALELLAIDRGPGMKDVDACMRDGFSTAGTPGTGLGAVSRLSSAFDVFSQEGKGTVAMARMTNDHNPNGTRPPRRDPPFEFGAICVALEGELECGDAWCVASDDAFVAIMIADGLGHGPLAARASNEAVVSFKKAPLDEPAASMKSMHQALSGTRGAAAACAVLDLAASKAVYSGVGNISGHLNHGEKTRGMVSHNGTLGLQLLRAQQFEYEFPRGSRLVMHSDGLSARWTLGAYPGLAAKHPAVIAGTLYRDFARQRDDATVVVGCRR